MQKRQSEDYQKDKSSIYNGLYLNNPNCLKYRPAQRPIEFLNTCTEVHDISFDQVFSFPKNRSETYCLTIEAEIFRKAPSEIMLLIFRQ